MGYSAVQVERAMALIASHNTFRSSGIVSIYQTHRGCEKENTPLLRSTKKRSLLTAGHKPQVQGRIKRVCFFHRFLQIGEPRGGMNRTSAARVWPLTPRPVTGTLLANKTTTQKAHHSCCTPSCSHSAASSSASSPSLLKKKEPRMVPAGGG